MRCWKCVDFKVGGEAVQFVQIVKLLKSGLVISDLFAPPWIDMLVQIYLSQKLDESRIANRIGHFNVIFFHPRETHVITQPQHSYTLVMKNHLALTLCVLCLVSLRGHYPNSSLRPLPRSQNFFWVTFCSTGCRTLFCHLSMDCTGLEEKGFLVALFSIFFC